MTPPRKRPAADQISHEPSKVARTETVTGNGHGDSVAGAEYRDDATDEVRRSMPSFHGIYADRACVTVAIR